MLCFFVGRIKCFIQMFTCSFPCVFSGMYIESFFDSTNDSVIFNLWFIKASSILCGHCQLSTVFFVLFDCLVGFFFFTFQGLGGHAFWLKCFWWSETNFLKRNIFDDSRWIYILYLCHEFALCENGEKMHV